MTAPQSAASNGPTQELEEDEDPPPPPPPPPETPWLQFIRDVYPLRHSHTHFLPPQHFRNMPFSVLSFEGEDVVVHEHPQNHRPHRNRGKAKTSTVPDPQVAGTVFTSPTCKLRSRHRLDTDMLDELAQESVLMCLNALAESTCQVMMVISQLEFRKYLDNLTDPVNAAVAAMLPEITMAQREAECDVLIVHLTHGLIVGEIKSVGCKDFFSESTDSDQDRMIVRQVDKAVSQLNRQSDTLRDVTSDLGVKVTKVVILPFLTSGLLMRALGTNSVVAQALCQCVDTPDLSVAVSRCLCKDNMPSTESQRFLATGAAQLRGWGRLRTAVLRHLPWLKERLRLTSWWGRAVTDLGADPRMTDDVYDRLLARFCGPATTVDVPTPTRPRKVVRSQGQAVAETGLTVSSLALYPQQVDVLSSSLDSDNVYLWGAPGTGKTLLLFLKAKQWAKQGKRVVILSTREWGRAVNMLIYEQLRSTLGPAAAASVQTLHCDLCLEDVEHTVVRLAALSQGQHLYLIVDELDSSDRNIRDDFVAVCEQLRESLQGELTVWSAGVKKPTQLPPWMNLETLSLPLRCPPAVHKEVKQSEWIDGADVPHYSCADIPAATDGPAVIWLNHEGQPGHASGVTPDQCGQCGHDVADELQRLRVGDAGHGGLQWRDVFILHWDPSPSSPMVQALRARQVPLTVLPRSGASDSALRDVTLALSDHVTVADSDTISGLERRVVVGTGGIYSDRLLCMSRTTALTIWIDRPHVT